MLLLEERRALEEVAASTSRPHGMVRQAKGLLMAADGLANTVIAERLGVSRSTVLGWRERFAEDGVKGIGKVRPGRPWRTPAWWPAGGCPRRRRWPGPAIGP